MDMPAPPPLYDEIASLYHLVYQDWEAAIAHQSQAIDVIVCERLGAGPHDVLDVSCGIGTQSLGLAGRGHRVTASDLSEASVERARREAGERGLEIAFDVRDMRASDRDRAGRFDVVLSADNSVPHLLDRDAVVDAFAAFGRAARPGGLVVVTVRDYARESLEDGQVRPYGVREHDGGRTIVFQTWDVDGATYDVTMYFVHEARDGSCRVTRGRSRYWAVSTDQLGELLAEAGLVDVERLDDGFYQPVLLARRPA